MIDFNNFKKIDLRIGRINQAEKLEGSDKLMKLEVDLGFEKRQIIAGIGQYYSEEDLKGKEVAVVINLEPRKIFGQESQGMILAADVDGEPILISPDKEVSPGSEIR